MNNYILFNSKRYALNLERIMDFVTSTPVGEKNCTQTINQVYGIPVDVNGNSSDTFKLVNKEVSETTDNTNDIMSNYRFNLITNILNLILVPISDGSGSIMLTNNIGDMHIGQRMAFNTLIEMEIIYEIDIED